MWCVKYRRKTTRLGYAWAGTTTNQPADCFKYPPPPPANTYLNQATQKNTCQILQPQEIPESKISNPRKSFDHPRRLKSGTPPLRSRLRSFMVCFSRWLKMAIHSVEVSQGLVFCITKVTKWTANCETSRRKIPFASCRRQYFPFVIQAKVWLTCPHISSHFWLFRVKFQEI